MEPGAPQPAVRLVGDRLFVAYICQNPAFPGWDSGASPDHPGFDELFAILEFAYVRSHQLGEPSDETLADHPLSKLGVSWYDFYYFQATDGGYEWVITF